MAYVGQWCRAGKKQTSQTLVSFWGNFEMLQIFEDSFLLANLSLPVVPTSCHVFSMTIFLSIRDKKIIILKSSNQHQWT